jgi:hypothetical protein
MEEHPPTPAMFGIQCDPSFYSICVAQSMRIYEHQRIPAKIVLLVQGHQQAFLHTGTLEFGPVDLNSITNYPCDLE